MMRPALLSAVLLPIIAFAADPVFPELAEIPAELRLAPHPALAVDAAGNFLVNGKLRHLIGMQINTNMARDLTPTSGYPDSLRWIYEQPLNHERAQRLGFDTLSVFNLPNFLQQYRADYRDSSLGEKNLALNRETWGAGLPLYVDFTCFPWTNGLLADEKKFPGALPPEAINAFRDGIGNHWVPYNVNHPAARAAWRACWEAGVKFTLAHKSPVIAYELFNEPAYEDAGAYNRRLFAEFLQKKYGTPDAMNAAWSAAYPTFDAAAEFKYKSENSGLFVDWTKFMEESFTDLCRFGRDVIAALDPSARLTVQPMARDSYRALPSTHVNLYEISRHLNAVTTPTGGYAGAAGSGLTAPAQPTVSTPDSGAGEGFLARHFLRAIADGKPIINSETYTGRDFAATVNATWRDLLLGSNVTYLFEWSKRGWDFKPAGSPEGGKRVAERYPWMILNPYAYPPENLKSFLAVKREIFRFAEFFAPRDRGVPREVALLLSFPTERYGAGTGYTTRNDITTASSALAFSHYPADAVLEEQLPEGRARRYRALIAAGVQNSYPETVAKLREFAAAGGILILSREFLPLDEYGKPHPGPSLAAGVEFRDNREAPTGELAMTLPQDPLLPGKILCRNVREVSAAPGWEVLATAAGRPALLRRKEGKGFIYLQTAAMQDYAAAAVLGGILRHHGLRPEAEVRRAETDELAANIEVHSAKRGERTAVFLFNHDRFAKVVRVATPAGTAGFDLLNGRKLEEGAVLLEPRSRAIVGVGSEEAFREFGPFPPSPSAELRSRAEELNQKLAAERQENALEAPLYPANAARLRPLDLRKFCNRGFIDSRPGDGKGGWTDQGADNSLVGVPWGVQLFRGIPCDVIRWDENEDRTCIVLRSKNQSGPLPGAVTGIPVDAPVKALYFFHAAAWADEGKTALTYRVHYADGSTAAIPVRCGEGIWDWWLRSGRENIAWRNSADRGFYLWRWVNPQPEKEVRSLAIESAENTVVALVVGITVELYDPASEPEIRRFDMAKAKAYDTRLEAVDENSFRVVVSEASKPWSGSIVPLAAPLEVDPAKTVLALRIRGGMDRFGNVQGGQQLQFHLVRRDDKSWRRLTRTTPLERFLTDNKSIPADRWGEVRIPLDQLPWSKTPGAVEAVMLQFRGHGQASGIVVSDMRFEIQK